MAVFAGAVALNPDSHPVSRDLGARLANAVSRHPGDRPKLVSSDSVFVAEVNLGVLPGAGLRGDERELTVCGGDPLLEIGNRTLRRPESLDSLHELLVARGPEVLAAARGDFSGVHWRSSTHCAWLFTDKLALRPLFYCVLPNMVLFANAQRILASLPEVDTRGDIEACAELASLGFALEGRTEVRGIRVLEPGRYLRISDSRVHEEVYWRWEVGAPSEEPDADFGRRLRDLLIDAVKVRLPDAPAATVALLSGGLDSRVIVSCLRHIGRDVHSISYGPRGSLDRELSRRVAERLGTQHFELERGEAKFWPRMREAHAAWLALHGTGSATDRQLWSGEGGDRVLAPVNLLPNVAAAMRRGDTRGAVDIYTKLEGVGLPRRAFTRSAWSRIGSLPHTHIARIVDSQVAVDSARRFHLYVLSQEARRNIAKHFEDLDLRRFEYIMPFYDSKFVAAALAHRLDAFLRHAFYIDWLQLLPFGIGQIPWQAYPTALPCPLPLPTGFRTQWQGWYSPEEQKQYNREQRELANSIMSNPQFPHRVLSRTALTVALWSVRLGMERYFYLFSAAEPFVRTPPVCVEPTQ